MGPAGVSRRAIVVGARAMAEALHLVGMDRL